MAVHCPRILLVEDSADDALFLRRALGRAGIRNQVDVVADGPGAIAYLTACGEETADASIRPMLVLLDLKLPRLTGWDVLAWIRRHPVLQDLPVMIVSSSDAAADKFFANEMGAKYLVKDVRLDHLVEIVSTIAERQA